METNTKTIIQTKHDTIKAIQNNKTQNSHIQNITNHLFQNQRRVSICHSQPTPDIIEEARISATLAKELNYNTNKFNTSKEDGLRLVNIKIRKKWNNFWKDTTDRNQLR